VVCPGGAAAPARGFVLGLLSGLPVKNCWTISDHVGEATPDGMQHLLRKAVWDADMVRDDLRSFVTEGLGMPAQYWWSTRPGT
jgi:hypothetical protein